MLQNRHSSADPAPQAPARPVVAFARDYPDGWRIERHRHAHDQLVYASAGLMRVETPAGVWVVPPQRAVWVPAEVEHEVDCIGVVRMRTLYLLSGLDSGAPAGCRVLAVSPLLRELVHAFTALPPAAPLDAAGRRLLGVLLDQIRAGPDPALHLPRPRDRRLRLVTEGLLADPADPRRLADWAGVAGASARTLARLFLAETGMGFRDWRRQLRLQEALGRLALGEPVTAVAFAVGYDSPSAFIAMFRRLTGSTPRRYPGMVPAAGGVDRDRARP